MEEVTIRIPEELRELARAKRINWQLLLTKRLADELRELARLRQIVSKSKLTEQDVEELSDEINTSLSKRYVKLLKHRGK